MNISFNLLCDPAKNKWRTQLVARNQIPSNYGRWCRHGPLKTLLRNFWERFRQTFLEPAHRLAVRTLASCREKEDNPWTTALSPELLNSKIVISSPFYTFRGEIEIVELRTAKANGCCKRACVSLEPRKGWCSFCMSIARMHLYWDWVGHFSFWKIKGKKFT